MQVAARLDDLVAVRARMNVDASQTMNAKR
jgi:hypothetical protein